MISAVGQTDYALETTWKQVGGTASANGAGTAGDASSLNQQKATAAGKAAAAYSEMSQLQMAANQALMSGNSARAMEAAMEATQIAASIRDLVGSAPAVTVGSIQLASDQVAQWQHDNQPKADASQGPQGTSNSNNPTPWQQNEANSGNNGDWLSGQSGTDDNQDGGTSLADAVREAMAAFASARLDTRA